MAATQPAPDSERFATSSIHPLGRIPQPAVSSGFIMAPTCAPPPLTGFQSRLVPFVLGD